jgi:hypothetical protein
VRAATSSESCSLDRGTIGEPSRSCHGEGHVRRASIRSSSAMGLRGVWGVARTHGSLRNRRGPSCPPASGKDRSYKPVVKSSGGKRESEGFVVPMIGGQHNPSYGKGPCFGRAGRGGTREGMSGTARTNHPGGRRSTVQARHLRRRLWTGAELIRSCEAAPFDQPQRVTTPARVAVHNEPVPVHALSGRPSVSRVRENRTHGLRGGGWNQAR